MGSKDQLKEARDMMSRWDGDGFENGFACWEHEVGWNKKNFSPITSSSTNESRLA